MDLVALKAELTAGHPTTGAYSPDDELAAKQLNVVNRLITRESLTGGELAASVTKPAYTALSAADKAYFNMLVPAATLPATQTLRDELAILFPAGGATRANLVALMKRSGSRSEELGLGTPTASDVADARRLP